MKKQIFVLLLASLFVCPGLVAQRVLDKAPSVEKFRPIGEVRLWTFVVKDSAIGRLISTVSGRKKVDGIDGVTLTERLNLDYNMIGSPMKIEIEGDHFVSLNGYYLGDKRTITVNEQTEKQEVERDGDRIEGYFTRAGKKNDQEMACPEATFAIENNFPESPGRGRKSILMPYVGPRHQRRSNRNSVGQSWPDWYPIISCLWYSALYQCCFSSGQDTGGAVHIWP
jgi:hypothetical protein